MTVETNSIDRAIGAAGFLARYLAQESVLVRCRLVNRFFAAGDGSLHELAQTLDQNVTVIDPREAQMAFQREFSNVRTLEDAERVAAESMERRLQSKEDVPMVEDFPLAPEEETSQFTHLRMTLQLRLIRAMEHWRGNTDLTLAALILREIKKGSLAGAVDLSGT